VMYVTFTQNTVNVCSLWTVVVVVGIVNILVNSVVQLELRTCFPQIYVLSNLRSPAGRDSVAFELSELQFPTSSPTKICLPLISHLLFSRC